jgi:hypothetical protein
MATMTRSRGLAGLRTGETTDVAYTVMRLLQVAFVIAPTIAGLDKFFMWLAEWHKYLAPPFAHLFGGHTFMYIVGVVEIAAGLLVAVKPRIGGFVVAAWLFGIIVNLVILNVMASTLYWDIVLRDVGLMVGAFCLGLLATAHDRRERPAV